MTSPESRIDIAYRELSERVERDTRFDRSVLVLESARERTVRGKAAWVFSPSFPIDRSQHAGLLPAHAVNTHDASGMESMAVDVLAAARANLSLHLEQWIAAEAASDAPLTAEVCLAAPQTFGYQFPCVPCGGHGDVTCPVCKGKRLLPCDCDKGWRQCGDCSGRGHVACPVCDGSGKLSSGASCRERVTCPSCVGNGRRCCSLCAGAGQRICARCNLRGLVQCDGCRGTKWQHVVKVLSCKVDPVFRVAIEDDNAEIVSTLRGRDLHGLRKIATARQIAPRIESLDVVRRYDVTCDVAELQVTAHGKSFAITAFGDRSEIFSDLGIVDTLLEPDLIALEQAVQQTRFRLWRPSPTLREATHACLASDANLRSRRPRFERALHDSLARLFVAAAGPWAVGAVVLALLLFVAASLAGVSPLLGGWVFPAAFALAMVGWALAARFIRKRIEAAFGANAQPRLAKTLARHPVLAKVHAWTVVAAIAVLAVSGFAVRKQHAVPVEIGPVANAAVVAPPAPKPPTTPAPVPASEPVPEETLVFDFIGVVCITNVSPSTFTYSHRWGDGPWETRSMEPDQTESFSGDAADDLEVRFDGYLGDGEEWRTQKLPAAAVSELDHCHGAREYKFIQSYDSLGVIPAEWTKGWPHPFNPNVIAGYADWMPAPGFRWYNWRERSAIEEGRGFIGVTIARDPRDLHPRIVETVNGAAAENAGLRRGMAIEKIDGKSTAGMSLDECRALLQGTPGEEVYLEVQEGYDLPLRSFRVVRQ